MPKISVIVPVYKVEVYLARCVDSILSQSFTDFELILVDDGSPDKCPLICDDYARKDSRVHVIHQENRGLSAARNAGIDWAITNSNSEWITFIDSDDWVHPQYLESLFNVAQKSQHDIVACSFIQTEHTRDDSYNSEIKSYSLPAEDFLIKCRKFAFIACAKLYKKSLFINHRFPVGKIHEDIYLTYKLLFSVSNIDVIENPLYYYYINPNGITQSKWTPRRLDEIYAHEQQLLFLKSNRFYRAFEVEVVAYLWVLCTHLLATRKFKAKYFFYRIALKFKLIFSIFKFRCIIKKKNLKWAYNSAFPFLCKIYEIIFKIRKVLVN